MQQLERGEHDLPVLAPLFRLPHGEVVRERHESDPRRRDLPLHGESDRWHSPLFDGPAYQPHGPVAQGSRGREQHDGYPILRELARHLGGGVPGERTSVVYGAHKGEVSVV